MKQARRDTSYASQLFWRSQHEHPPLLQRRAPFQELLKQKQRKYLGPNGSARALRGFITCFFLRGVAAFQGNVEPTTRTFPLRYEAKVTSSHWRGTWFAIRLCSTELWPNQTCKLKAVAKHRRACQPLQQDIRCSFSQLLVCYNWAKRYSREEKPLNN